MYRLLAKDLNVLVDIQYGLGFGLLLGNVEIETTIFKKTRKSKAVPANKNRINFNQQFIWKIDRDRLKYNLTTNENIKIECFTTPYIPYENILGRQRIGYAIIRLKDCQIIGRDWDQDISMKSYNLQGSSKSYVLQIILVIQEHQDLECSRTDDQNLKIVNKENNSINENTLIKVDKQGNTKHYIKLYYIT